MKNHIFCIKSLHCDAANREQNKYIQVATLRLIEPLFVGLNLIKLRSQVFMGAINSPFPSLSYLKMSKGKM